VRGAAAQRQTSNQRLRLVLLKRENRVIPGNKAMFDNPRLALDLHLVVRSSILL
jgi:hypothetical protein